MFPRHGQRTQLGHVLRVEVKRPAAQQFTVLNRHQEVSQTLADLQFRSRQHHRARCVAINQAQHGGDVRKLRLANRERLDAEGRRDRPRFYGMSWKIAQYVLLNFSSKQQASGRPRFLPQLLL